MEDIGINEL
jgi:predicted MFS family arabinose efflux permease